MMNQVKLLDCTLRDGGYVNDWHFGHETMISVLERLVGSGIDLIEVGFLDARRPYDPDRSIFPDTESAGRIYSDVNKKSSIILGMIDYGTCPIENIQPCKDTYLDGIRVIFKKEIMRDALHFVKQIKDLGYIVYANCVSITSYSDDELKVLIDEINKIKPNGVAMVDTYGLLHQEGLVKIFDIMDTLLDPSIQLAYHAHNNFQMGYANGIEFLSRNTARTLVVDGTLYGMGKSAGNTPLELLSMYMNEHFEKKYDISLQLDAIDMNLLDIYQRSPWGYKPFFFIAASQGCHPNYVSFLMNKGTLSMKAIQDLLGRLTGDKKLLYDQKLIERLYLEYQTNECDDKEARAALRTLLEGREILVLGPGKSVKSHLPSIHSFIRLHSPVVIAINLIPEEIPVDYLFATNNKRYTRLLAELVKPQNTEIKLVATSNLSCVNKNFSFVINYGSLIDASTDIPDNSLIMLLRLLLSMNVGAVSLAGFDGYTHTDSNYLNAEMEYSFVHDKVDYLNSYMTDFLQTHQADLSLSFVTPSGYEKK